MISISVIKINMANCIRGQGRAPTPETPTHWGTDAPVPQTPSANFYGLILRIALGATRGDAELERDRERFGCQWSAFRGGQWVLMPQSLISMMNRYKSIFELFRFYSLSWDSLTTSFSLHSHGFCEIARLIHVEATAGGNVVGQELQGNDGENRGENLFDVGYRQNLIEGFDGSWIV
jgi:hypothetical protein